MGQTIRPTITLHHYRTAYGPGREVKDLTLLKRAERINPRGLVSTEQYLQIQLEDEQKSKEGLIKMVASLEAKLSESLQDRQSQLYAKETQLLQLKHEQQKLISIVSQQEKQLQSSIPHRKSLTLISLSALVCVLVGLGKLDSRRTKQYSNNPLSRSRRFLGEFEA